MVNDSIDALLRLESRLNRSFALCVALYVATSFLLIMIVGGVQPPRWIVIVALLVPAGLLAGYVWFAIEVALTAKALGKGPVPYVLWMIVAPFLALVPIPVVSILILVSPMSLRFLLAGQLRKAIHDRTQRSR